MADVKKLAKLKAAVAALEDRVKTDEANAALATAKAAMSQRKLEMAKKRAEAEANAKA